MPGIFFEGPRIRDIEKKRELVKAVTDAAVRAYGMPAEMMVVLIKENAPENVAIGGTLIIDKESPT